MRSILVTRVGDTIFIPLPVHEWRVAFDGKDCQCPTCKADLAAGHQTLSFWDTLCVGTKVPKKANDVTSTCHYPELHSRENRVLATKLYLKDHPGALQHPFVQSDGVEHEACVQCGKIQNYPIHSNRQQ